MRLYLNAWKKKEGTYELNSGIIRDEKKKHALVDVCSFASDEMVSLSTVDMKQLCSVTSYFGALVEVVSSKYG